MGLDVKTSLFRVSSDCDPVQDPTFGPACAILHTATGATTVLVQYSTVLLCCCFVETLEKTQWRKVKQLQPRASAILHSGVMLLFCEDA